MEFRTGGVWESVHRGAWIAEGRSQIAEVRSQIAEVKPRAAPSRRGPGNPQE